MGTKYNIIADYYVTADANKAIMVDPYIITYHQRTSYIPIHACTLDYRIFPQGEIVTNRNTVIAKCINK